jgi:hypothetical protein
LFVPLQIFLFPVAVGAPFPLSQSATLVDGLDKQDAFLLLALATAQDKHDKFWPVQEAEMQATGPISYMP